MNRNRIVTILFVITAAASGILLSLFSVTARSAAAQSAGIRLVASDGVKAAVEALLPQLEHAAGQPVTPVFGASKELQDKIVAGDAFDVTFLTSDVIDSLVKQGKIAARISEIGRTGMGVGVRAGTSKPAIGTPDEIKQTLLHAKSISFNPSGASAAHINDMFLRLGIADAVKSKLMLDARPGQPQKFVAEGKADLVITLVPEIKFFPGVELVGPLPKEFQSYINFAAGVSANTHNAHAAEAIVKFITSPAAASTLKAKGIEPK